MKFLYLLTFIGLFFYACDQQTDEVTISDRKNNVYKDVSYSDNNKSQNALDWDGTYAGRIDCHDCENIHIELTLHLDHTYVLTKIQDGQRNTKSIEQGNFSWSENGNSIILNNRLREEYIVEENAVHLLQSQDDVINEKSKKIILTKNE